MKAMYKKLIVIIAATTLMIGFQNCAGQKVSFLDGSEVDSVVKVGTNGEVESVELNQPEEVEPENLDPDVPEVIDEGEASNPPEPTEPVVSDPNYDLEPENLIVNGDFEMLDSRMGQHRQKPLDGLGNNGWDVFSSLPGEAGEDSWVTTAGPGIEIQKSSVRAAQSGNHYVELDSHGGKDTNSEMVQNVKLPQPGQYLLTFFYHRRTKAKNDNNIIVAVNGTDILEVKNTPCGRWLKYQVVIEADMDEITLSFRAAGKDNSYGGFLDNVSLIPANTLVVAN